MLTRPRIYLTGGPNEGKSNALIETAERPLFIVNAPGENGHATISAAIARGEPDVVMAPLFDPFEKPDKILADVEKVWLEAIKTGKYKTMALEGLDKYMDRVMDDVTGGAYLKGDDFDGRRQFGQCYRQMGVRLDRLMNNMVPTIVLTGWDKNAKEDFKDEKSPKFIQPRLIGEYATMVKGQIGFVFHHRLHQTKETDAQGRRLYAPMWQVRPDTAVRGLGMKGDKRVIDQFQKYIKADFRVLSSLWAEYEEKVKNGTATPNKEA